jgi:hypothetical protein
VYLLDEALGIEAWARVSPTLTFLVAGLGLESSYQKAADGLAAYIGVSEHATFVKRALAKAADSIADLAPDEVRRRVPALDVEADGTYVHRQRTKAQKAQDKKQGKTSRWSYTEVGTFVAYEGKRQVGKNKKQRINCLHHASTAKTPVAWAEFGQMIAAKWDPDALFVTNLATDGAAGYRAGEKYLPGKVVSGYDLHHIISVLSPVFGHEIAREIFGVMREYGFEEGYRLLIDYRDWYVSQGTGEHYKKAADFITAHADQIRFALVYNLGTIESTNAHLIGSRLKRFGGGWSSGLEPMVRLRAYKASRRDLPKSKAILKSVASRAHKSSLTPRN